MCLIYRTNQQQTGTKVSTRATIIEVWQKRQRGVRKAGVMISVFILLLLL